MNGTRQSQWNASRGGNAGKVALAAALVVAGVALPAEAGARGEGPMPGPASRPAGKGSAKLSKELRELWTSYQEAWGLP